MYSPLHVFCVSISGSPSRAQRTQALQPHGHTWLTCRPSVRQAATTVQGGAAEAPKTCRLPSELGV